MSLAKINDETRALLEYAIPRGTDMDKMAMLQLMRSMDLNPLRKEVYAIPYQGKLQIVIGVDGWRKAAHATGRYLSGEAVYGEDEYGVFCTYTVLTTDGGRFSSTCWLSEFKSGSPLWGRMPRHMLAVKAEVHALKRAFGLAGPTEWDHDDGRETIVGEPVRAAQDDRLAAMNRLLTSSAEASTEASAVAPRQRRRWSSRRRLLWSRSKRWPSRSPNWRVRLDRSARPCRRSQLRARRARTKQAPARCLRTGTRH